jgi:hypothetical protein
MRTSCPTGQDTYNTDALFSRTNAADINMTAADTAYGAMAMNGRMQ